MVANPFRCGSFSASTAHVNELWERSELIAKYRDRKKPYNESDIEWMPKRTARMRLGKDLYSVEITAKEMKEISENELDGARDARGLLVHHWSGGATPCTTGWAEVHAEPDGGRAGAGGCSGCGCKIFCSPTGSECDTIGAPCYQIVPSWEESVPRIAA